MVENPDRYFWEWFRKRRFIESFFINSTPNVVNEKSSDLFPKIYEATFG